MKKEEVKYLKHLSTICTRPISSIIMRKYFVHENNPIRNLSRDIYSKTSLLVARVKVRLIKKKFLSAEIQE